MPKREKSLPESFWKDDQWMHDHHDQLSRLYANEWIAVVNKTVVASGKSIEEVKNKAEEKTGKRNVPIMFIEKGIHIYENFIAF